MPPDEFDHWQALSIIKHEEFETEKKNSKSKR
jgi:hypothetical protein